MVSLVVGEAQRSGECAEQLWRWVPRPALLESHEVFDADTGEHLDEPLTPGAIDSSNVIADP